MAPSSLRELSVNPDNLGGDFDSGLIPNGSFETDTDADNVPDGWTNDVNDSGSSNSIDATGNSTSGVNAWRTQSTGSGGGELVTDAFFPVNDQDDLRVFFDLKATVAAVRNIVRVQWYDASQVAISNTDVYDSTANPLVFTSQQLLATPPSGARFAKLRIIGGATGGQQAGITYWDRFQVFYPQVVAGVFDNITINSNDISVTNPNGDLNINILGTGTVEFNFDAVVKYAFDNVTGFVSQLRMEGPTGRFTDANAVALGTDVHALQVGATAAANIAFDGSSIQGRNNGAAAALAINDLGGGVAIGPQAGTGSVTLYNAAAKAAETDTTGINILSSGGAANPATPDNVEVYAELQSSDGNAYGQLGFIGGSDSVLRLKKPGAWFRLPAHGGEFRRLPANDD